MKNRVHIAHAGDAVPGGIEMPKPGGRGGSRCIAIGTGSRRIRPSALSGRLEFASLGTSLPKGAKMLSSSAGIYWPFCAA